MKKECQIVRRDDSRELAEFLSKEGQLLLPIPSASLRTGLDLIEKAEMAVDELIDIAGRATIEAVLTLSAQQIAGPKRSGSRGGDTRWHGRQGGVVPLAERKLRVSKPRLRRKGRGKGLEVEIPAYEALQTHSRLGRRMLEILMQGISTRKYQQSPARDGRDGGGEEVEREPGVYRGERAGIKGVVPTAF